MNNYVLKNYKDCNERISKALKKNVNMTHYKNCYFIVAKDALRNTSGNVEQLTSISKKAKQSKFLNRQEMELLNEITSDVLKPD